MWVRDVLMYQRINILNLLLWSWELYLKDYCPYLNSSYFVVNLNIKELIYSAKHSTIKSCLSSYYLRLQPIADTNLRFPLLVSLHVASNIALLLTLCFSYL